MRNLVNPIYRRNINQYGLGSFLKKAGNAIGEATKGVGNVLHDVGLGVVDTALGTVGMGSVIDAGSYKTKAGGNISDFASEVVAPIGGQIAANAIAPGIGGMVLGQVQQIGSGLTNQPEEVQMPNQIVDMTGTGSQARAYANANYAVNPAQLGYAYGGYTNTYNYGGMIDSSKVNSFNVGGTHEQNPYGGIPIGMGANGKMNTVEEGEVSVDIGKDSSYIFSDRLTFDRDFKKKSLI